MEKILPQIYSLFGEYLSKVDTLLSPSTRQVALIVGGVFLFALLFGFARRHMLAWSIRGAWFGLFFGIFITLFVEAIILVSGKTAVGELLSNQRTPQNVRFFIEKNMTELAQVIATRPQTLGASGKGEEASQFLLQFDALPSSEQQLVKQEICTP